MVPMPIAPPSASAVSVTLVRWYSRRRASSCARLSACVCVTQPGILIFSGLALVPLTTAPLLMSSRM